MRSRICLIVVLALVGAARLSSAGTVVTFDPDSTDIRFDLGATLHTVHGTATLARGAIEYDETSGEASGEIVVDATSADTQNSKRDKKMHSKVLESEKFPQIILRPKRISGELLDEGPSTVTIYADLSLHGATHNLSVPVQVSPVDTDSYELTAEFEVPYVEWGLEDPSTFLLKVAKEVQVTIEARVVVSAGDPGIGAPDIE